MSQIFKVEMVSWTKVSQLSRLLANKVLDSGYQPDIVIAIARGGLVPARLLCDHLDIYNLTSIRITHYTSGANKAEVARLNLPLNVNVNNMKVLLVDDVDDTGDTLQLALAHINTFNPADVKVAVLHHKLVSTVVPDFYAQKITRWRWLTYPWAVTEDLQGFIKKMQPLPDSVEEALERLSQQYNLNVSEKLIKDVYRNMKV